MPLLEIGAEDRVPRYAGGNGADLAPEHREDLREGGLHDIHFDEFVERARILDAKLAELLRFLELRAFGLARAPSYSRSGPRLMKPCSSSFASQRGETPMKSEMAWPVIWGQ